jgi:hypothetical protein
MSHKLNSEIAVIGIDIGKNSFHIVGHDKRGAIMLRRTDSAWTSPLADLGHGVRTVLTSVHFAPLEGRATSVTRRQVLSGLKAVMLAATRAVLGPRLFS